MTATLYAPRTYFRARRLETMVDMGPQSIYPVRSGIGSRIRCVEGMLWVTIDDDPRDICLEAGESYIVDSRKRVLVQAFARARWLLTAG